MKIEKMHNEKFKVLAIWWICEFSNFWKIVLHENHRILPHKMVSFVIEIDKSIGTGSHNQRLFKYPITGKVSGGVKKCHFFGQLDLGFCLGKKS